MEFKNTDWRGGTTDEVADTALLIRISE
jgi:hypothetical protein